MTAALVFSCAPGLGSGPEGAVPTEQGDAGADREAQPTRPTDAGGEAGADAGGKGGMGDAGTDGGVAPSRGAIDGAIEACPSDAVDPRAQGAEVNDANPDNQGLSRAFALAASGSSVVCLQRGRYVLEGPLAIPSGVQVLGFGSTLAPAAGVAPSAAALQLRAVSRVRLVNLAFDGVRVSISGTAVSPRNARGLELVNVTFVDGASDAPQLEINRAQDVRVVRARFSRSQAAAGRSLSAWKSAELRIAECTWSGHFMTAINVNGADADAGGQIPAGERSEQVVVEDVDVSRVPGTYAEDHGLYAWGVRDLVVRRSTFRGWSSTAFGGSLKLRNAEQLRVHDNTFVNSGVLLYTYTGTQPAYLRDVTVERNTIDVSEPLLFNRPRYGGVTYWRNFDTTAPQTEAQLVLRDNRIIGGALDISPPIQAGAISVSGGCALAVNTPNNVVVSGVMTPCPPAP